MSELMVREQERADRESYIWAQHFPKCELCGEPIVEGDQYIKLDECYWHTDCFTDNYEKRMCDWRELG